MNARVLMIPRRALAAAFAAVVFVLGLWFVTAAGGVGQIGIAQQVADDAALVAERGAVERAVGRAYDRAADQLAKARGLKLAISDQAANAIVARTLTDLRTLRRNALQSVADAYGMRGDEAQRYVAAADGRLAQGPTKDEDGILLAPRLYAIVIRMNEVAAQLSDSAARELTNAFPGGTPTPAPTR